jgi:hypothetical protein
VTPLLARSPAIKKIGIWAEGVPCGIWALICHRPSPIRLMSKLAPDAKTAMSSNTETAAETPHKKGKHHRKGQ